MHFWWLLLGLVATLASSAPIIPLHEHGREPSPQCDPGEEDDCAKCYDVLVNELIVSDHNRFTLQRHFFPPDVENPVFVEVKYYFTRNLTGDGTTNYSTPPPEMIKTWFWTKSSSYLFQPLESIQFTSLLFSDPGLREDIITLYLQPRCQNSSDDMMMLLTQRVSPVFIFHRCYFTLSNTHACMCS